MGERSFAQNVATVAVSSMVIPAVGFLTAPLLAHGLGVEGRGELAGAVAPFLLLLAIAPFGIGDLATFRTGRTGLATARTVCLLPLLAIGLSGLLCAAVLPFVRLYTGDAQLARLVLLSLAALPLAVAVTILRGVASGQGAWLTVAWERAATVVLRLVGLLVLLCTGHLTVTTAAVATVLSFVLSGVVYIPLVVRAATTPRIPVETPSDNRSATGFAINVWFGSLAGILLSRADQVLMTPLSDASELGIYVVAVTVAELVLVLSTAVRDVLFATESGDARIDRVVRASRLSLVTSAGLSILIGATFPLWCGVVFGPGFDAALPALVVMLVACTIGVPGSVAGAALAGRGRPGRRSVGMVAAVAVNVPLVVVLVPQWGAVGAAFATLVGNAVAANNNILWLSRMTSRRWWDFHAIRGEELRWLGAAPGRAWRARHPRSEHTTSDTSAGMTR
ncbi:MAG: oligosaccharide flippase family protein [Gordonia paraffinivorans]